MPPLVKPRYRVKAWRRPNEDSPVWRIIVARLPEEYTLRYLLEMARGYKMTDEEIAEQRASWARQMMD